MPKQSLLYTRKGDAGQTSILDKVRLSKGDTRLELIGTLDELNAQLGLAQAQLEKSGVRSQELGDNLSPIQADLLSIGSYFAHPTPSETAPITEERIVELEQLIDQLDAAAPPLTNFILPGGSVTSATLHVARAVSRRAERCVVRFADDVLVAPLVLKYLNRLSDVLFAAARAVAHANGAPETIWKGNA